MNLLKGITIKNKYNNMRLTIKNYKAIIGQTLPNTDWLVSDVSEDSEWYHFYCRIENGIGYATSVRLKRDGVWEHNQWKYRFWHPPGYGISQITTDWFADINNAKSVIGSELKKLI
jgi:hypothetical protein